MAIAYQFYYIQRLSDGKILGGEGPNSVFSPLDPNDWRTLTGAQIQTQARWVYAGAGGWNWNSQKNQLNYIIDNLPSVNGAWDQDMFRVLPIQWKGNL
jgi:hypothetical protein